MKNWKTDQKILGAAVLNSENEIVFSNSKFKLTKQEVATVLGHTHVTCVKKLQKVIKNGSIPTLDELANIKGVGITTLFSFMTILEKLGKDPLEWINHEKENVTLPTIQKHAHLRKLSKKSEKTSANDGKC